VLTVSYQFEFQYSYDTAGKLFPRLEFQISDPGKPEETIDVQTYLDCGAEKSLMSGWIGVALGIDVLGGKPITYQTGAGTLLSATLHAVRLFHPDLGGFDLEVGFSTSEVPRNLLGRDFFNRAQIGFREHHLTFFVTPTP